MPLTQSFVLFFFPCSWVGKIPWRRDRLPTPVFLGFPCGSTGKESACNACRPEFDPWVGKIPWRRERLPTPVFWPGEFHGYGPWGRKESDTTERLTLFTFTPSLADNTCQDSSLRVVGNSQVSGVSKTR